MSRVAAADVMTAQLPRKLLVIPVALVVLIAAVWLIMAMLARGPLTGESRHDFGVLTMESGTHVELHHSFHLTNRTARPLTIKAARPDCGCVSVNATFPLTVQPGASIDLPVTMHFGGDERSVLIQMDCGDAGVQILRVSARSMYLTTLSTNSSTLTVSSGGSTSISVFATVFTSQSAPPTPAITASQGLTATIQPWVLPAFEKNAPPIPRIWQAQLSVKNSADALPLDAAIVLQLEGSPPLRIAIVDH